MHGQATEPGLVLTILKSTEKHRACRDQRLLMNHADTLRIEQHEVGICLHLFPMRFVPVVETVPMLQLRLKVKSNITGRLEKGAQAIPKAIALVVVLDKFVQEIMRLIRLVVSRWHGTTAITAAQSLCKRVRRRFPCHPLIIAPRIPATRCRRRQSWFESFTSLSDGPLCDFRTACKKRAPTKFPPTERLTTWKVLQFSDDF